MRDFLPVRRVSALVAAFLLVCPALRAANPFLHPLFTSHMVLQRDIQAPIFGWTTAGATVTVTMNGQNYTGTTDATGRWQVLVGPLAAGGPYTVTVASAGQTTQTLTDVLMGDVWLCAGQSNMAFSLNTIGVLNLSQEIADSVNYPNVRGFTVPLTPYAAPQVTFAGGSAWTVPGSATTGNFSATGYFMAREIYKQQGVPVGFLVSAYGGTEIKAWTSPTDASAFADLGPQVFDDSVTAPSQNTVSGLYNGMIAPLAGFKFKGVAWYQGEYNTGMPEQYSRLLPMLMGRWRTLFGQANLPFVIIQLPNIGTPQTLPVETGSWAELREAQMRTAVNDPYAKVVTTIDIGAGMLHPVDKQDVGLRAARAAAVVAYGQNVVGQGPIFTGATVAGGTVRCSFSNVGGGLMVATKDANTPLAAARPVANGTLTGFALAGANGTFYAATATIDAATNTVLVSSGSVPAPVAVRYGWGAWPACNLYNKITDGGGNVVDGLPASPFRNDPRYKLNVNYGTGTGYYALNSADGIAASAYPGETFDHWSGDTAQLSSSTTSGATATLNRSYLCFLANSRVTGAPAGLAASAQTGGVSLGWTAMNGVHYNVKRATGSGGPFTTVAANLLGAVTSFVDGTVGSGTTYYYTVSAVGPMGEGPNSAAVAVTTLTQVQNVVVKASGPQDTVSWSALGGAGSYSVKRATTSGGPYTTMASGVTALGFVDQAVVAGMTYFYVVTAMTAGGETPASAEVSATPTFVPAPMQDVDVETVGKGGGAVANAGGTFTLTASGAQIGASPDSFNFAWVPLTGNGTITARVVSEGNATTAPEAGVMMRGTLSGDSNYARMYVTPTYYAYQGRYVTGGATGTSTATGTSNRWVRVVRSGNNFTGYTSTDGATWTQKGTVVSATMTDPICVGLFLCANSGTTLDTAVFDNVSISGTTFQKPPAPTGFSVVVSPGALQAAFKWNATQAAASYTLKKANSAGGTYTTVASGLNAVSYLASNLTAGTTTYYKLSATDLAGEGPDSAAVVVDLTPPVSGLVSTALSESQIRLTWTNNAPDAASYVVQRLGNDGTTWTTLASLAPSATAYIDGTLNPSTNYQYRVQVVGADGSSSDYVGTSGATPTGIGDSIPGWWRQQYFGNGLTLTPASAADADPDGDGMTNLQEYLAGTDPTSAVSNLRVTSAKLTGGSFALTFGSVVGKAYMLEKASTLGGAWTLLQDNIAATGAPITLYDNAATSPAFYRVEVK